MTLFSVRLMLLLTVSRETQQALAKAVYVDPAMVSRWVNSRRSPKIREVRALAEHFGVPFIWLAEGVDIPIDKTGAMEQAIAGIPYIKEAET